MKLRILMKKIAMRLKKKNVARKSMRKSLHIQIRYSLRGQKRENNAFLIIMPNVFWLERADALKYTHLGS